MTDAETIEALARVIACFKVKQEEANASIKRLEGSQSVLDSMLSSALCDRCNAKDEHIAKLELCYCEHNIYAAEMRNRIKESEEDVARYRSERQSCEVCGYTVLAMETDPGDVVSDICWNCKQKELDSVNGRLAESERELNTEQRKNDNLYGRLECALLANKTLEKLLESSGSQHAIDALARELATAQDRNAEYEKLQAVLKDAVVSPGARMLAEHSNGRLAEMYFTYAKCQKYDCIDSIDTLAYVFDWLRRGRK